MSNGKTKRALISVYDKTGIIDFAKALVEEFGFEIISTGGTAKLLSESNIPVTRVEEVTGFPEMMDGRVKTLHPKIHAGILADRGNAEHMRQLGEQGIEPIDMVVVNLYPFDETVSDPDCTLEQAIEMIDIGGPCMLRAAAKNHKHVLVVYDAEAYDETCMVLTSADTNPSDLAELRLRYAAGAFEATTCYDAAVAKWLGQRDSLEAWPWLECLPMSNWGAMRYGENPHQLSELLAHIDGTPEGHDLTIAEVALAEDEPRGMSFNNYADAHAALAVCAELARAKDTPVQGPRSCCVFVKHTNACGVGMNDDPVAAYAQAYLGDPNAAMGGILACDFSVDAAFADTVMGTFARWGKEAGAGGFFVEVWIAPSFDDKAIDVIRGAKKWGERVRLLQVGDIGIPAADGELEYKSIAGGMLVQTRDTVGLNEDQWKVVSKRPPTEAEMADLRLAWLVCKHTKSNAITICKDNMLIGNGAGQMSRVMSCRIATWLAKENGHVEKLPGAAAASDAFFPFPDGPTMLMDAGVTAIIQPGGSKRDDDTIAACNERDVALILTGTRHFKH